MAFVITKNCIGVKDRACVEVCPVESFYEGADQLYIHPNICVDCGLCPTVCPVLAIYQEHDVPVEMAAFVEKNAKVFTDRHQANCACGYCDPTTNKAIGQLPVAKPK